MTFDLGKSLHKLGTSFLPQTDALLLQALSDSTLPTDMQPQRTMTTTGKPRQPRLRASCDGCFIAKVKCSKARPSCSRCLACGIECRYSPSSRIGKFKSEPEPSLSRKMSMPEFHTIAPVVPSATDMPQWQQSGNPLRGTMRRQASMVQLGSNGGSRDLDFPWTPPNDMGSPFSDLSMASPPMTMDQNNVHQAILSSQMPMGMGINAPWMDSGSDVMGYLLNPAFAPTPSMSSTMTTPTSPLTPPQSACTCFQTCLQALNNLQRAVSPMFGNMTKLNAQAVEACAAMLNCVMCMSHPNRHTAMMSIATIMTAANTLYGNAIPPTGLGIVSTGADQNQWMKVQILISELDRLQKLYHHFNDACNKTPRLADGMAGLGAVMAGYIGQAIASTMEAVRQRSMDHRISFQ